MAGELRKTTINLKPKRAQDCTIVVIKQPKARWSYESPHPEVVIHFHGPRGALKNYRGFSLEEAQEFAGAIMDAVKRLRAG